MVNLIKIYVKIIFKIKKVSKPNTLCLDIFPNRVADMYGCYHYCQRNIPEAREQFSLCYEFGEAYLFGGQSTKLLNDIWTFNPCIYVVI